MLAGLAGVRGCSDSCGWQMCWLHATASSISYAILTYNWAGAIDSLHGMCMFKKYFFLFLWFYVFLWFLRASAMLKHVIDIGWTSVRPSVRLSVTRWHYIKTAEYLVKLSLPHDSPFTLVLCISRSSRNSDGVTPCGVAKYRWGIKNCAIFYQ